ncbi:sugar phosphate isomerase/epimerase family protein [Leifsonia sp. LS-T14]|uniref:sugar phosphate isomerase/epimerase family protein n=1 Tax=unclassified Leifsonia TaxID=2663824 RepID=UPI0035A73BBD
MTLVVSNIAWEPDEEPLVADTLQRLGVTAVEIAPTKVFADPVTATDAEIDDYLNFWRSHGVAVVAFQSMLFGRPELTVFDDTAVRARTAERLAGFLRLAGQMGVGPLVFGSPKNRRVPSGMPPWQASEIAAAFFRGLAEDAEAAGAVLCIEPNPPAYECNFVNTAAEGRELVDAVGRAGFGLHLDAAGLTLAGDDLRSAIETSPRLDHFHISAPFLAELEDEVVDHAAAAGALLDTGYAGHVSIEMRPAPAADTVARLERAVGLARRYYAPVIG